MLNKLKRIPYALKRTGQLQAALIPMNPNEIHPVFKTHAEILQPLTRVPLPSTLLHVIGRIPYGFSKLGYRYIAEVEGATGPAPVEYTKFNFDIVNAHKFINKEIDNNKLKRLVFQSGSALEYQKKWMSEEIKEISTSVDMVPPSIIQKKMISVDLYSRPQIRLLMIISNPILKGLFVLPKLIDKLLVENVNFLLTVVSARKLDIDDTYLKHINYHIISKLTVENKQDLFNNNHFLLNISPMDTLGSFLDSAWFNTPMITVYGQHAGTYVVNKKTGYIINSPIFYYSDKWGIDYRNAKIDFKNYLLSMELSNWDKMVSEIVYVCSTFDPCKYNNMVVSHYNYCIENFSISRWLETWETVYESSDIF